MDPTSASNLSLFLHGPKALSFAEKEVPSLRGPHDVLVAVNYTGICGSDIHLWERGYDKPVVLGHESAGTIVKTGPAVGTLRTGDRVALEPGIACWRCERCLGGYYNLCSEMTFAAAPPVDGTLTGFYVLPEHLCYQLPDGVSLQEGALLEPLAVAVHVARLAAIVPGQSVVVLGSGPVGILCAAVARVFGASKLLSVDIVDSKLDFARSFCAANTYKSRPEVSPEENAAEIQRIADLPNGADVVVDASGFEPSIRTALAVVRRGGTFVQAGMGKADVTFPIMALCTKEVTAKGSFRYNSGDFKLALELVSTGVVRVRDLITGVVSFDRAEEAYDKVKRGEAIKMLIAGPNEKLK